jgi:L-alanine-DL-glutamate epimerase-like enolase superfamily enzyme
MRRPFRPCLAKKAKKSVEMCDIGHTREKSPGFQEAEERVAAGFSAIKLKLGFGDDDDVRLWQAVRKTIGDGLGIMVDPNHAYDAPPRSGSAG